MNYKSIPFFVSSMLIGFVGLAFAVDGDENKDKRLYIYGTTDGCLVQIPFQVADDEAVRWKGPCSAGYASGNGLLTITDKFGKVLKSYNWKLDGVEPIGRWADGTSAGKKRDVDKTVTLDKSNISVTHPKDQKEKKERTRLLANVSKLNPGSRIKCSAGINDSLMSEATSRGLGEAENAFPQGILCETLGEHRFSSINEIVELGFSYVSKKIVSVKYSIGGVPQQSSFNELVFERVKKGKMK